MFLKTHSSNTIQSHLFFIVYIIIDKIKQQVTENEENTRFEEREQICPGVSSDIKHLNVNISFAEDF